MSSRSNTHGFSFLEMSLSLALLGVLAIGLTAYVAAVDRAATNSSQERLMRRAEQALVAFFHANHHLPCPAADGDGAADCGSGQKGFLPWQALGLADARAGKLRYGVYRGTGADLTQAVERIDAIGLNPDSEPVRAAVNDQLGITSDKDRVPGARGSEANLLDACHALGQLSHRRRPLDNDALRLVSASAQRNVAYALAAPGASDADDSGEGFDGRQNDANPVFDWPNTGGHRNDDRVAAAGFSDLAGRVACGEALASIGHAPFNTTVSAEVMERTVADYLAIAEEQLNLAEAKVLAAEGDLTFSSGLTVLNAGAPLEAVARAADTGETGRLDLALAGIGLAAATFGPAGAAMDEARTYRDWAQGHLADVRALRNGAEALRDRLLRRASEAESDGF
jgi:prepilin-type N-terminal cleavage/methylation domain-containing protein